MLLSRHTRRRDFITLIGGAIATWPALAHGQQNRKPCRIGIPADIPPSAATNRRFGAFRDGLKELGYAEGSNIVIDYRDAVGSRDGLIALCKDMIASGADVIVAGSTNAALAALITTKTVPIVMRAAADPVAVGLVESLARPGGNITGVTSLATDLSVFQSIATGRFDALDVLAGPIVTDNRARILAFSNQARTPDLYQERPFVEAGGLLSYGPNFERLFHRMAYYVDRILKGAKLADLPVERPTKFELFINLRTAKALGLTIPAGVLSIADEVIE
jgi:putative tryptophan/tyrosine transport system substrate-binding protein